MPLARLRDSLSMWPKWLEALIVIVGAFGLAFISTARYLFDNRSHAAITEHHLRFLLIYEPITFLILGSFLFARGWTLKRVGLAPRLSDAPIGVGLALGAYTTYAALWIIASAAKVATSVPPWRQFPGQWPFWLAHRFGRLNREPAVRGGICVWLRRCPRPDHGWRCAQCSSLLW